MRSQQQQPLEKKPPLTLLFTKKEGVLSLGPDQQYFNEKLEELEKSQISNSYDNESLIVEFSKPKNNILEYLTMSSNFSYPDLKVPISRGSLIENDQALKIALDNRELKKLTFVNVALEPRKLCDILLKCRQLESLSFESMFGGSEDSFFTSHQECQEAPIIRAKGLTELLNTVLIMRGDLTKLSCKNSSVNDDGLDQIAKLSKLQELDLTNVENLSAEKLSKLIKNLPELQKLNLAGCSLKLEDLPLILDALKTNDSTTKHPLQSLTLPFKIEDPATLQQIATQTNLKFITFACGSESYTIEITNLPAVTPSNPTITEENRNQQPSCWLCY
jgi:hypothetical protein